MTPLIFAMPGNGAMAEKLALTLGTERRTTTVQRFPDGESYARVESAMEGWQVAIVCTLGRPDDKLTPLPLLTVAIRENGATDAGLIASHPVYTRQDSCLQPGETVNARHFVVWLLHGFGWLITIDPHLHRITKLSQVYVIPARHVHAAPVVTAWLRAHMVHPVPVGPDEESNQRMTDVANRADTPMVVLHKVHKGDRDVEVSVPDVEHWYDRAPMLVDDIVSIGHTMIGTIGHLQRAGLAVPVCIVIHAVSSGSAIQDLEPIGAGLVVSCDTVVHPTNEISVTPDLASVVHELMQDPGGAT